MGIQFCSSIRKKGSFIGEERADAGCERSGARQGVFEGRGQATVKEEGGLWQEFGEARRRVGWERST